MPIIKSHEITLYGGNNYNIVLKPLSDKHLLLLYKWNSDLEVLYWTESNDITEPYDMETVHDIYGRTSQNAVCFLVEANGVPVGECWLQKMNMPDVIAMYPAGTDIRRIDMSIGEKNYWNKGIGTEIIRMLVNFAFNTENADVLHCFCEDYNIRSQRVWEKNGFMLVQKVKHENCKKSEYEYHYALTRQQYNKRSDWDIRTYELGYLRYYRFVVIFAKYKDKWLYSRHKDRNTWETAGGHIEIGETALEAAKRELYEETGAVKFEIRPMFDYSVHTPDEFANGQVYFADITELGDMPGFEMKEVGLFDTFPEELTYPKITPTVFKKLTEMI